MPTVLFKTDAEEETLDVYTFLMGEFREFERGFRDPTSLSIHSCHKLLCVDQMFLR
jgi:hypothetical protein